MRKSRHEKTDKMKTERETNRKRLLTPGNKLRAAGGEILIKRGDGVTG